MGAAPARPRTSPPTSCFRSDGCLPPTKERRAMAKRTAQRAEIKAVPQFLNESLYVGIDIGKGKHLAGFLSKTLLERHERFEACPAPAFENSREGFRRLIQRTRNLSPLEHVFILMHRTGHYHRPLAQ